MARFRPGGGAGGGGAGGACLPRQAAWRQAWEQYRRRPERVYACPHAGQVRIVTPSSRGGVPA